MINEPLQPDIDNVDDKNFYLSVHKTAGRMRTVPASLVAGGRLNWNSMAIVSVSAANVRENKFVVDTSTSSCGPLSMMGAFEFNSESHIDLMRQQAKTWSHTDNVL